ncbi:hypothetical protein IQ06DRAFT_139468 [Phaeosphaeriaceae sp. SRC1lsM3a]|nr:hypothetical protein IQ06DRAFT_139468 [Stagonospora sp. SRC1lsM3a]
MHERPTERVSTQGITKQETITQQPSLLSYNTRSIAKASQRILCVPPRIYVYISHASSKYDRAHRLVSADHIGQPPEIVRSAGLGKVVDIPPVGVRARRSSSPSACFRFRVNGSLAERSSVPRMREHRLFESDCTTSRRSLSSGHQPTSVDRRSC